jgi:hypothetical protein
METDPQELTDLADDPAYAQIRATMTDRLLQRIFAARPHVPRFHPYW